MTKRRIGTEEFVVTDCDNGWGLTINGVIWDFGLTEDEAEKLRDDCRLAAERYIQCQQYDKRKGKLWQVQDVQQGLESEKSHT